MSNIPTSVPALTQFEFQDSKTVRAVIIEGEPWFVAADVCSVLEHTNTSVALSRLDDDENGVNIVYTLGGNQEMNIINESGLYSLILTSRKPEAKKFKKWATAEVLPAIRKSGQYVHPQAAAHPGAAPELFTNGDMQNLQRLIWLLTNNFRQAQAAVNAVWHDLRLITGSPAPRRFQIDHIPTIVNEMRRLFEITGALGEAIADAEHMVIRRILRNGESADKVLAEARAKLLSAAEADAREINGCLAYWRMGEAEINRFSRRELHGSGVSYGTQEPLPLH